MKYLILAAVALLLSCSTIYPPKTWEEVRCKGKVQNGCYFDRGKLFSLELPRPSYNMYINEQHSDKEFSDVFFQDHSWSLQVIVKKLDSPSKPNNENSFREVFKSIILPSYKLTSPNTKLLHEKNIESSYFVICELPEASRTINLGSGKRGTAIKGCLIFIENDLLVTFITDLDTFFAIVNKDNPEKGYQKLEDDLLKYKKSFRKVTPCY